MAINKLGTKETTARHKSWKEEVKTSLQVYKNISLNLLIDYKVDLNNFYNCLHLEFYHLVSRSMENNVDNHVERGLTPFDGVISIFLLYPPLLREENPGYHG